MLECHPLHVVTGCSRAYRAQADRDNRLVVVAGASAGVARRRSARGGSLRPGGADLLGMGRRTASATSPNQCGRSPALRKVLPRGFRVLRAGSACHWITWVELRPWRWRSVFGSSASAPSATACRAISGPLTTVTSGLSRSLADTLHRRSGPVEARMAQIPKLTVRVRFSSPAPVENAQLARSFPRTSANRLLLFLLAAGGLALMLL